MNAILMGLGMTFMTGGLLCAVMMFVDRPNFARWDFAGDVCLAIANGFAALAGVARGDLGWAAFHAAFAGWCAWCAWRGRPRPKRRTSRVASRVKDLGHRLAVVPVGAR